MKTTSIFFILLIAFVRVSYVFAQQPAPEPRDLIDVVSYDIKLTVPQLKDETYLIGRTTLKIALPYGAEKQIQLDFLRLTADSVYVNGLPVKKFTQDYQTLYIPLASAFKAADTTEIIVVYHGEPVLDPVWGGFYFIDNVAFNMGVGMSSNPPSFGRCWFPCNDHFPDRAFYTYHITAPPGMLAVCPGILQDIRLLPNGIATFTWELDDPIPTYLSSVAIGDYTLETDVYQGIKRRIPISNYYSTPRFENGKEALRNLKQYLKIFEEKFGPYRWQRVGYVSVPFWGGAMEHATSISIPDSRLNTNLESEMLFIHELSHHWFGNLVTCATPADMWLNEGWASYCESIALEAMQGKNVMKQYLRSTKKEVLLKAHKIDGGYHPLYPVPQEATYGMTVYDKGALAAHGLRCHMGDDKFFSALKAWFEEYAFSHRSVSEFCDFLSAHSGLDLKPWFADWIYEPGFPAYCIKSLSTSGEVAPFEAHLSIDQQLKGRNSLIRHNRVTVRFFAADHSFLDRDMYFKTSASDTVLQLPFKPQWAVYDPEETLADARIMETKMLTAPGRVSCIEANFTADVKKLTDSLRLIAEHYFVAPGFEQSVDGGIKPQGQHYWRIGLIGQTKYSLGGIFHLDRYHDELDKNLTGNATDYALLYRPAANMPWQTVKGAEILLNDNAGQVTIKNLLPGEYVLGRKP